MVRIARVLSVALLSVTTIAGSVSAECVWVLWTRTGQNALDWSNAGIFPAYSKCWATIQRYTGVAEEGSVADWYDWMRGLGRYYRSQQGRVQIVAHAERVLMIVGNSTTEWRCLPESMDPRRSKGE